MNIHEQRFLSLISGLEKKWKRGGINWNDQIMKTFFNNGFNNEMHKLFIALFILAVYIVYYNMFHGMNNQFEILRSKNGMTTTLMKIIKNTKSFTTVNSTTTNDIMDWEYIITSSFTKMARKKTTKWVSPAFIKKIRSGIVGHKINKYVFLFARRPVVTATVTNWFGEVKA